MSDYDGLRSCANCGNYTTGRLCTSCAQQEMIDNGGDAPEWVIEPPIDDRDPVTALIEDNIAPMAELIVTLAEYGVEFSQRLKDLGEKDEEFLRMAAVFSDTLAEYSPEDDPRDDPRYGY